MKTKVKWISFKATQTEFDSLVSAVAEMKENSTGKVNRNLVMQALVRNFIDLGPAFLADELLELKETNRRLLGIGRNLNQVVKRIHAGEVSADTLTQRHLEEVAAYVRTTKDSVDKLVEHNQKRGQIELGD